MPSLSAGDLEGCLTGKLQAEPIDGGRHRRYKVYDDQGVLVAMTLVSRGWRPSTALDPGMVSRISRQLQLDHTRELVELVSCTLSRDDYLERAKRP